MGAEDEEKHAGKEERQKIGTKATPEQLDDAQKCLEDLFSKSNLAEDGFIRQHMTAEMYIPLCILAAHHNITKLGPASANIETLLAAAQRSDVLSVDVGSMLIRPAVKNRRNTLILHDLPEGVPEEELRELFASCPEFGNLSCIKPDVNHTVFVSFKSDESAQTAALWLRSQKLRGEGIKCAVKSEHGTRSFFPAAPPVASPQMSCGSSWGTTGNMSWPPSPWIGAQRWQANPAGQGYGGDMWGGSGWEGGPEDAQAEQRGPAGKGKTKGNHRGMGEGMSPHQMAAMAAHPDMMGACGSESMEGALPGAADMGNDCDDVEVGYQHDFRRYSRQDLIEICSAMEVVSKPESFTKFEKEDTGSVLLRPNPCKDWAPLPTPMLSFASSLAAGEGRRGPGGGGNAAGGDGEGDDHCVAGAPRSRRARRLRRAAIGARAAGDPATTTPATTTRARGTTPVGIGTAVAKLGAAPAVSGRAPPGVESRAALVAAAAGAAIGTPARLGSRGRRRRRSG